jgi:formylglycine-generating enzyme required for sulfatase activity
LAKIVQLPFVLPPMEAGQVAAFIRETVAQFPEGDERCAEVLALGVEGNPRRIKRCLNAFLLLWHLAQEQGKAPGLIRPVRLAKVVVIQQRHGDLYRLLVEEAGRLARLEAYFREEQRRDEAQAAHERPGVGEGTEVAMEPLPRVEEALKPFTERHALRQLLTMHGEGEPDANFVDVPPEQLRDYIHLARATATPSPELERGAPISVPETVAVPAGSFLIGTREDDVPALVAKYKGAAEWYEREVPRHEVNQPAFEIGRHPVTNQEYRAFVRDAGYRPPRHWDGDEYPAGKGDHPVVCVSWRDALAYCRWLSARTGRAFRLPTEAEWEKAARGTDGRQYPWGNAFDPAKCNTYEGGPGDTTPVGQHPGGASPYGVSDAAGNVWEWCSGLYRPYPYDPDDGREDLEAGGDRTLRGGSWNYYRRYARVSARSWSAPDSSNALTGFRVAASPAAAESA